MFLRKEKECDTFGTNTKAMKKLTLLLASILIYFLSNSQVALTGVTTVDITNGDVSNYTNAGNTYNWSTTPINVQKKNNWFYKCSRQLLLF